MSHLSISEETRITDSMKSNLLKKPMSAKQKEQKRMRKLRREGRT